MISAFEITAIILLFIGIGLVVWWYMEAGKYDTMLGGVAFAKGANMIYDPDLGADNTVTMSCPAGKQVCVYQATQICTDPDRVTNLENYETDPISRDLSDRSGWSKFNLAHTVDLTQAMNTECGVTGTGAPVATDHCSYIFDPKIGDITTDGSIFGCGGAIHLLAGYTCEPTGSQCKSTSPISS